MKAFRISSAWPDWMKPPALFWLDHYDIRKLAHLLDLFDYLDASLCPFQDWVRATEELVDMGRAGLTPSARSARQWRLASAVIEETGIELEDDYLDFMSKEDYPDRSEDIEES